MTRRSSLIYAGGMLFLAALILGIGLLIDFHLTQYQFFGLEPPPRRTEEGLAGETRPAYCKPLPKQMAIGSEPTPTPNAGQRFSFLTPDLLPSVTPLPIDHNIDLNPEIPLVEKSEIIVYRCDGTYDRYYVGGNGDISSQLELREGDVILSSAPPAKLIGVRPPDPIQP